MKKILGILLFPIFVLFTACSPEVESAEQFRAPYREHLTLEYVVEALDNFYFPEGIHYALMSDEQVLYMEEQTHGEIRIDRKKMIFRIKFPNNIYSHYCEYRQESDGTWKLYMDHGNIMKDFSCKYSDPLFDIIDLGLPMMYKELRYEKGNLVMYRIVYDKGVSIMEDFIVRAQNWTPIHILHDYMTSEGHTVTISGNSIDIVP